MAAARAGPAKTIVVAVDGSEPSREVGRYAVGLARRMGSRLRIIHVIDPSAVAMWPGGGEAAWTSTLPELRDTARRIVAETEMEAALAFVAHSVHIAEGFDAARAIVGDAEAEDAELIVVGSHGRTGVRRALIGSVAERVVRTAGRPVLVYRVRPRRRKRTAAGVKSPRGATPSASAAPAPAPL